MDWNQHFLGRMKQNDAFKHCAESIRNFIIAYHGVIITKTRLCSEKPFASKLKYWTSSDLVPYLKSTTSPSAAGSARNAVVQSERTRCLVWRQISQQEFLFATQILIRARVRQLLSETFGQMISGLSDGIVTRWTIRPLASTPATFLLLIWPVRWILYRGKYCTSWH